MRVVDKATGYPVDVKGSNGAIDVVLTGSNTQQQPLIIETMDFAGKTSGQTFDVPHTEKAKLGASATATFDAPSTFGSTDVGQSSYNALFALDGTTTAAQTTTNGAFAQQLFSFDLLAALKLKGDIPQSWDVAKLKANVKRLNISWTGYGVGSNGGASTNGATLKLWNASTGAWASPITNTSANPSMLSYNIAPAGNPSERIDTNGFVHLLAHSTHPSDGTIASTIYTDYVKLDVTLLTEVQGTDVGLAIDTVKRTLKTASDLSSSFQTVKSGVTGLKTITTTAAELFAGSSARLAKRWKMVVYNPLTSAEPILFGYTSGACNRSILPGNAHEFYFDPATAVPIYFKTVTASVFNVEVEEVA